MLYTFALDGNLIERVDMFDDDGTKLGEADWAFIVSRLKDGFIFKEEWHYAFKINFTQVDDKILINDTEAFSLETHSKVKGIQPEYEKVKFVKVLPPPRKTPTGKKSREGFFIPAPDTESNKKAKARFFGSNEGSIWSAFDSQKYGPQVYEWAMRRAMDGEEYNILGNPDVINPEQNDAAK